MEEITDEELAQLIAEEEAKDLHPNYKLADLIREQVKRAGYGITDTKDGPIIYKL